VPYRLEIKVPTNKVYVWNGEGYDLTRWITIAYRGADSCILQLTDLCQPGKLSRFSSVNCAASYLRTAFAHGTLQITLSGGHLLLHREADLTHLEFRGKDDLSPIKATFLAKDLIERLASSENDASNFALSI